MTRPAWRLSRLTCLDPVANALRCMILLFDGWRIIVNPATRFPAHAGLRALTLMLATL